MNCRSLKVENDITISSNENVSEQIMGFAAPVSLIYPKLGEWFLF